MNPNQQTPKKTMVDHPGKDDVHEQREPNQPEPGVVHDAPDGGNAPKDHPWRRKVPARPGVGSQGSPPNRSE